MIRVVLVGLVCVLATCQYSWAYQSESPQQSDGLIGVLADIVMAPCGLLAACLGLEDRTVEPPYHCLNTYGPEKKAVRRVVKEDSSTRIKKVREAAPPDRTPPVRWHRPPSDRPETQASAPPLLIPRESIPRREPQPPENKVTVPAPQPVAPTPPIADTPAPGQPSPVPADKLPPQLTVKPPETTLPPARVYKPEPPAKLESRPPAMSPPRVMEGTPRVETPKKETPKPELEKIAPPGSTAPPKTDEPGRTEKKRRKSPCGPVYHGCYPGYYWR